MAGVGKSAIGNKLAQELNYKFVDIDKLIEKKFKLKLQEIVDKFGEDKFLKIEENEVLGLRKISNCVISPGGSVIYSPKAMEFLKRNSLIVFLNSPFETIKNRIKNQNNRGLIGLKKNNLKNLFDKRFPLYKKYADIIIEIPENLDIDSAVGKVKEKIFDICP